MRKYLNMPMAELATELTAGLLRLRKGYVDAAESVLQIVKSDQEYPYEFVVYRITGYRGERSVPASPPMPGRALEIDLHRLILDLCDSFELKVEDYPEPTFDTASLARRYNVSTKTIQRWRNQGLPGRRLVFPDGKRRIGFLESSVNWFVSQRQEQIARSRRFTQLTAAEREDIIMWARRLAAGARSSPSSVARRLAARLGRAAETVRYTIRKHDLDRPEEAVFPFVTAPLSKQERVLVYRSFLRGVPVPALSKNFRRTRGSIYRIVNEMRARQLIERPIRYIYNPQFDLPNADEIILAEAQTPDGGSTAKTAKKEEPPGELAPYFKELYEVPLLDAETERDLFRKYSYLKFKADNTRKAIDVNHIHTGQLKQMEQLLLQANVIKNRIIRANLRLVVSIAKKHLSGPQTLLELVSDGNVSLMRAAEKFDYSRGYRFSTYASWAIMRNFARSVPKEQYRLGRFPTGSQDALDIAASLRAYDSDEVNLSELRESIDAMLAQLLPQERAILINHYGLDEKGQTKTLNELGRELGLSKERVRQIELKALKKLRTIIYPQKADFLA